MWIIGPSNFSSDLETKIFNLIGNREDRQDRSWINLETGARVILASNGGWRTAESSAYHALYISPAGELMDVSYGLLRGPVDFDATQKGSDTYNEALCAATKYLEDLLHVVQPPQPPFKL